jgi:hypothetical protein
MRRWRRVANMTTEKKQVALPLIERKHANTPINQRAKDGYINATAMCKAAKKRFHDYSRLNTSEAFVRELTLVTGIPVTELIQTVSGGFPELQGTWVHPQVAIHLAQWLSPQFAVQVTQWVFEWLSGGPKVVERLPYHLRRYVANMAAIPRTHFSVLQELTYGLIAPMEADGYTLPEYLVPDISQARMFSKWLWDHKRIDPSTFPTYLHRYEDGRVVQARLYPNELLADFRAHFQNVWLPLRAETYFSERDPRALSYLPKLLAPPTTKKAS